MQYNGSEVGCRSLSDYCCGCGFSRVRWLCVFPAWSGMLVRAVASLRGWSNWLESRLVEMELFIFTNLLFAFHSRGPLDLLSNIFIHISCLVSWIVPTSRRCLVLTHYFKPALKKRWSWPRLVLKSIPHTLVSVVQHHLRVYSCWYEWI